VTLDLTRFDALTFDCYGTLIDWETGLLCALRDALPASARADGELLEEYARHEAAAERGPYHPYREVLATGLRGVAARDGLEPGAVAVARFSVSVRDWPAFPDSAAALAALHRRFRLGVITNCDTDLFAASQERLGVAFDWVVTAEEARAYKPSHAPFELAFERIDVPRERILHVAQSLYHDHVPARELGLASVWIDRRAGQAGPGSPPPAVAAPDATYPSLGAFAAVAAPA
jgi:2-haloacid dehalogenase